MRAAKKDALCSITGLFILHQSHYRAMFMVISFSKTPILSLVFKFLLLGRITFSVGWDLNPRSPALWLWATKHSFDSVAGGHSSRVVRGAPCKRKLTKNQRSQVRLPPLARAILKKPFSKSIPIHKWFLVLPPGYLHRKQIGLVLLWVLSYCAHFDEKTAHPKAKQLQRGESGSVCFNRRIGMPLSCYLWSRKEPSSRVLALTMEGRGWCTVKVHL